MRFGSSILVALTALAGVSPAEAQRADDNAVTAAEDAFGSSVGNESIGLYSPGQVREFRFEPESFFITGEVPGFLASLVTKNWSFDAEMKTDFSYRLPAPPSEE